jgi:Domain of unknown function (DUF4160)
MFYGLIVSMYFMDNKKHKLPHIHIQFSEDEAIFTIPEGELLEGSLPKNKLKLAVAWIELHQDELMANWQLAVTGNPIFPIDPLK